MDAAHAAVEALQGLELGGGEPERVGAGHETEAEQEGASEGRSSCSGGEGPGDLTCAICLDVPAPVDLAIIKGCEHLYCVHCILQWAMCKETAQCPQCKKPFNYLYVHRMLDGTVTDFPFEESVCLLKRARWFEDHVKTIDKGKAPISATAAAAAASGVGGLADDQDWAADYDYDDEDDEIENYYFSSAAGRARVVLGNRRLGENGFMRAGRIYARPTHNTPAPPSSSKGGKAAGPARTPGTAGSSSDAAPAGSSGAGGSSSRAGGGGTASSAAGTSRPDKQQGRRAKRNARRTAADEGFDVLDV